MTQTRQKDNDKLKRILKNFRDAFDDNLSKVPSFAKDEIRKNFIENAAKVHLFLSNNELVETYLKKLNNLIQANMSQAGLQTDELQRDHRKSFRETLEDELEKAGFASGLGKAIGQLKPQDFLYAVSQGVLLKDPGAPLAHGEFTHAIQWILISWHQKETNFLNEPVIDFFKKIGTPNSRAVSDVWDKTVDQRDMDNFTCPEYMQKVLIGSNDPDMKLLKTIITARAEKRENQAKNPTLFANKDQNKPRTKYDETKKTDNLLLPKPTGPKKFK